MIIVKSGRNILIGIFLLTSIILTTIVYSAFSTQLQISGEAIVRSDNDIRITNVKILSLSNNAYETYNNKYTKDTTSMFVTLPSNSSITYEVEITDKSNVGYIIESIDEISNTNSNVDIDIGLNQYDLVNANSTKKFNIIFYNSTSEEQISTLVLKYQFLENRFIVTFDANGGTVDILTKEVIWGSNYGELPIPTRDGYTFKGWNGKNLFNEEELLMAIDDAKYENGYYVFNVVHGYQKYGNGNLLPIEVKDNSQYTYTVVGYANKGSPTFGFSYTDLSWNSAYVSQNIEDVYVATSNMNKTLKGFYMSFGDAGIGYIKRVQLELGDVSTEYEPYYVTNNTKVTQMKNHTLTAIWEENE